ncbi:MAG: hypothetical protein J5374_09730 [Bacteroidales bacterium]|nr:hypothetical protein [Bacteroidales bacterium]
MARNFFVRSDADVPENVRITDQATFEGVFGMAAFMGRDGQPTSIDWDREFVIAVVKPVTDVETVMEPLSLIKKGGALVLSYSLVSGQDMSYTIRPFFIIVVDKQWEDLPVVFDEQPNIPG